MNAKTSIVIPVCNQLGYTRICIDYLLKNTLEPFELVIVDNGSTDGTREYFNKLSEKIDIQYVQNSRNLGPIVALNQGITKSGGDVICTMHNDLIIFAHGWLGKLTSFIISDNAIGLVGFAGRKIIDKRGVVDEDSLVHNLQNENLNPPMENTYQEVAVLDGVFIAARRDVFEKLRCFDEVYGLMHCYDIDISLKSIRAGYSNSVLKVESLHIFNGGVTRKTKEYRRLVPDDTKLLNTNSRIFFKKWRDCLPIVKA